MSLEDFKIKISDPLEKAFWVTLWEGEKQKVEKKSRVFSPPLKIISSKTKIIKATFNCMENDSWYEIDCVRYFYI